MLKRLWIVLSVVAITFAQGSSDNDKAIELLKQLLLGEQKPKEIPLLLNPNDPCKLKSKPTAEQVHMATMAWQYFEKNVQERTGLMNAANKFKSASVWDWANGVYGIFAAKKLGIISQDRFERMLHQFLRTMQEMKMFNNELPNKTYNTKYAKMTNYRNEKVEDGTGWSVADIARLLAVMNVIYQCEYNMRPAVEKLMLRYRYCRLLSVYGDMYGASFRNNEISIHKETMTGYEEYLARSMELWGHNADEARRYKFVKEVELYGVKVPTDTRKFYSNFVGSESYWNTGFDYGPDDEEMGQYVRNIYQVQEERYNHTGQLTAITEDNIDRKPYFLYNTIYTNGEPFKIINHDAEDHQKLKSVSTKAGLSMKHLFNTPYSHKIFDYLKTNYDPENGYYAGIYETTAGNNKALTLNTNSNILKGLLYANIGALQKLVPIESRGTYDHYRNTINNFQCLPTEQNMTILEPFEGDKSRELNATELKQAQLAWLYFENNYHPETGFINGSNKYKIISTADIATGIKATLWAKELGLISEEVFKERTNRVLETLASLSLFNDELPNIKYHAITAEKVSSSGKPSPDGNGYKLYDVAQLLSALYHLQKIYPEYQDWVFSIVSRYDFSRAIDGQEMNNCEYYGVDSKGKDKEYLKSIKDPAIEYYIFAALRLFNIKSYSHFVDHKNLNYEAMYNHEVPMGHYHRVANGETYMWAMMELPYYLMYKHYSSNIYLTLKDRYEITGKYATSSMEYIDKKPHTIFNDIYNNNRAWSDFDKKERNTPKRNIISVKSAFIYDALYGYTDDYAKTLMDKISILHNKEKGWYGGYYNTYKFKKNRSVDALTNMAVLASFYYKKVGNFYYSGKEELFDKIRMHHFKGENLYTLESKSEAFFYKVEDRFKDFDDNVTDMIRIVRKDDNFTMHYGVFNTKAEADAYKASHDYQFRDFEVVATPLVDDRDFFLANRYYSYDYHHPYENKMIDEPYEAYEAYYKKYKEAFELANGLTAKERAKIKKEEYKKRRAEEKKRKKEEKARKKAEKKAKEAKEKAEKKAEKEAKKVAQKSSNSAKDEESRAFATPKPKEHLASLQSDEKKKGV
jgi:hypothetical protein